MSARTVKSVNEQKSDLRKVMRKNLQSVSTDDLEVQSLHIARKVFELPDYQDAKALSIFLSMPGREVATRNIVLQSLEDGKKVFVPYIYKKAGAKYREMDMLQLISQEDLDSLKADAWGIPTLGEDSIRTRTNALGGNGIEEWSHGTPILDLIFMPALAFDLELGRLGHGKGFYDHYLARYNGMLVSGGGGVKMPKLIGLSLRQQMLPFGAVVPSNDDDWRLDMVVVGEG